MEDHRAVNWPISPHHARVHAPRRTGLQRSGPLYPDPGSKAELKQHGSVHLRRCPQVKWRASGGAETEKNPLWLSFRGSSSCRLSVYLHAGVQVDSAPCQLCRLIDTCHIKGKMTTRCRSSILCLKTSFSAPGIDCLTRSCAEPPTPSLWASASDFFLLYKECILNAWILGFVDQHRLTLECSFYTLYLINPASIHCTRHMYSNYKYFTI